MSLWLLVFLHKKKPLVDLLFPLNLSYFSLLTYHCLSCYAHADVIMNSGAGIMVTGANGMRTGEDVVIAGLFIQIAFFGLFIVTATVFLWRMQRNQSAARLTIPGLPWRKNLLVM